LCSSDNFLFESNNNLSKLPVLCCVVLSFIHSFIHSQIERKKVLYTHIYISYSMRRTHFSLSFNQCVKTREIQRVIVCEICWVCLRKRESEWVSEIERDISNKMCVWVLNVKK
jgi:hypothetical protein